jgi:5-methylcytosine-specific restriction endonuclease McrA
VSKICTKCKIEKPLTGFYKKLKGLTSHCKECRNICHLEYRTNSPDKIKEISLRYYWSNPAESNRKSAEWYKTHKKEIIASNNKYAVDKYHRDPLYKFIFGVSSQLREVLTADRKHTKESRMYGIVGLTGDELFEYLWKTFESRYGRSRDEVVRSDVEIDHIIPKSTAKSIEEAKKLNHYTNLQLLLKEDNKLKRNKLPEEMVKEIENE